MELAIFPSCVRVYLFDLQSCCSQTHAVIDEFQLGQIVLCTKRPSRIEVFLVMSAIAKIASILELGGSIVTRGDAVSSFGVVSVTCGLRRWKLSWFPRDWTTGS